MKESIVSAYLQVRSIHAVSRQHGIGVYRVRKILYDSGYIPLPDGGDKARTMYARGASISEICKATNRSRAWVYMMVPAKGKPYIAWRREEEDAIKNGVYPMSRSKNAVKIKISRLNRRMAV